MKKFKKALLSILSLALVAVLSIGGTLAYLTSEDSDVNVMTMGNVKIAQHEYERVQNNDGSYKTDTIDNQTSYVLQDFTQDKPLYPIVGNPNDGYDATEVRLSQLGHNSRGGMSILKPENVQDKFVVVENTGRSDAYVRTIVAFEAGSLTYSEFDAIIEYSYHFTWTRDEQPELIEIDGQKYFVVEFVYNGYQDIQHPNGVLAPGDYTYNNLAQVYMKSEATNEDVEAIDGNGNGKYDILVLSQAVQTKGFANAKTALDSAFGKTVEKAAEWFEAMPKGFKVENQNELAAAVAAGETVINLSKGNYSLTSINFSNKTVELIGVGEKTVVDFSSTGGANGANVTLSNMTINGKLNATGGWYTTQMNHANSLTVKNATVNGFITTYASSKNVFEKVTFNQTSAEMYNLYVYSGNHTTDIIGCTFNNAGKGLLVYGDSPAGHTATTTVNVKNTSFNATAAVKRAIEIDGSFINYVVNLDNVTQSGHVAGNGATGVYFVKAGDAYVTVNE